MTRSTLNILISAFILICALAPPVAASARTAHVHAGPGPTWGKSFEIPSGAHVKVGSCQSGWGHHDWCKVTYRGKNGFIHEGALKPYGRHAVVAPIVTTEAVRLHKNPASASPAPMTLGAGAQVDVAHCSKGWLKGWCRVHHNGRAGFVEASSLRQD